jgi:hypothetical protein
MTSSDMTVNKDSLANLIKISRQRSDMLDEIMQIVSAHFGDNSPCLDDNGNECRCMRRVFGILSLERGLNKK